MKRAVLFFTALAMTGAASASDTRTFTGVVSDSMCARDHAAMRIDPEDKCVRECVSHAKKVRYVLLHDDRSSVLSDQETPAKFAGRTVTVRGVLYEKTGIIRVESIEAAR